MRRPFASLARTVLCASALIVALGWRPSLAQSTVRFLGLGDSIGEGVQSADANFATQPFSFLHLIALHMGAPFPLPLITTGLFTAVGNVDGRARIDPTVHGYNLAVSGADAHSILYDKATATDVSQIDTETELVLFPELGSQIEIAERLRPEYVACWIGNNDALGAALSWDQLNGTQLTPIADFTADFTALVERLEALGTKAVFGTIPDITSIAFLLNRQDLVRFLGSDYGLADGALTSLTAAFLVKLGLANGAILSDPNFVLDASEQQAISAHILALNAIIRSTVQDHGMALVETHGIFNVLAASPFDFFGVQLSTRFLGGIFSLDGVHPSNTGHALTALFFIDTLNRHYNANIPQIAPETAYWLLQTDPHVDRDGDGRVIGRLGGGLLETMLWLLLISGDSSDVIPAVPTVDSQTTAPMATTTESARKSALDEYQRRTGTDLRRMSFPERIAAMDKLFGTDRFRKDQRKSKTR